MIKLNGKSYDEETLIKAVKLYEALTSGKLVHDIKRRIAENE